jgi:hypothetical protein
MKVGTRILFLFGLAIALTTTAGVVLNYSPVPFWDQWFGTVNWYMQAENNWWPSFWSLHNEHRLLFSRLIFWPDMRWFGGVNILSLASNVVVCGVLALSVYRASVYRSGASKAMMYAIGGLSMAFCFSWMQSDNFTWGFQNQWFAVNLFALLAFHSLAVSADKQHDARWFVAALLACTTASFSMANGSIAWLLVIALTFYWRFPWRYRIATIAVCGLVVFFYFHHASGATGSIPHGTFSYVIRHQLFDWIHYSVLYLGSPMVFAFVRSDLADLAGITVLLTSMAGVVWALVNRNLKAMPLLGLALFLCATAFATGTGRLVLGLGNVFQARYATNALLVWMALLIFWTLNLKGRLRWPVFACALIGLVSIAICQRAVLTPNHDILFERLVAGQAVRVGVYDHTYMTELWGHDEYLEQIIKAAKKEQISILAPNSIGFDNPPSTLHVTDRCAGFVDGMVPTETVGFSRAEGWVFDPANEPKTIVITDADGNTIGNGVVGKTRRDAAAALKTKNLQIGWVAFYQTKSSIHVFAKTGDKRYCLIE